MCIKEVKKIIKAFTWRIYGSFWKSIARKHYGLQSQVSPNNELFFVDRKTGKTLRQFDQRRRKP